MLFDHLSRRVCTVLTAAVLMTAVFANPAIAASESYAKNWPQWRGPTGQGIVLHGQPPMEWSETKNIKWKVAIPGKGHATPIIWDDKVFILTAIPQGEPPQALFSRPIRMVVGQAQNPPPRGPRGGREGERPRGRGGFGGRGRQEAPTQPYAFTTMCLDRQTGRTLWQKTSRQAVPHERIQPANTYSSGSPVTDGEHVFVSFGSQGLYCYDMDGNLVWDKDLGQVDVTFGEASSPALHGDTLLVLQDNNGESFLYAFDKKTGREIWKKQRDERSGWTTPYIIEHGGKTQVIVNGSNAVRSYDIETGDLIWQCSGLGSNPVPVIVSDEEAVYAMSGHREGAALAIELGHTGDLTGTDAVRWTTDKGTPYVPSPLLYHGLLYFCQRTSGMLTCLDAKTGKAHYEQERLEDVSGIYASPIGVQDKIYWPGQNGATLILEASKELKILAKNQLEDAFDASPAVVGNELFLRGHSHLYCIAAN